MVESDKFDVATFTLRRMLVLYITDKEINWLALIIVKQPERFPNLPHPSLNE